MKHIRKIGTGYEYPYISELFKTSIGVVEFWATSLDCSDEEGRALQCDKCILCGLTDCDEAVCVFCSTPVSSEQDCLGYYRKPIRRGV